MESKTLSPPSSCIILIVPFRSSWPHKDMDIPFTLTLSMLTLTHPSLNALTHQLQNDSSWQERFMKMQSNGPLDRRTMPPFEVRSSISKPITPMLSASPNVLDNYMSRSKWKGKQCIEAPPAYLLQMLMLAFVTALRGTSLQPPPGTQPAKSGP